SIAAARSSIPNTNSSRVGTLTARASITASRLLRTGTATTISAEATIITTITAATFRHRAMRGGSPDNTTTANPIPTRVIHDIKPSPRAIPMGASTKRRNASTPDISGVISATTERPHDEDLEVCRLAPGAGGIGAE